MFGTLSQQTASSGRGPRRRRDVSRRLGRLVSGVLALGIGAALTGCMALDELDAANAKMSKKPAAAAPADKSAGGTGAALVAKANPLLEKSKDWWDQATSLSPAETKTSVVQCRLPGSTQFMDRDDCLSRGGIAGAM